MVRDSRIHLGYDLGGTWTAEQDHHLYLDEIVISKQPIGPLGSEK